MEEVREFNYGKLYNFFQRGAWIQGAGNQYKVGIGMCWCLGTAVPQFYREEEALEARRKLLEKIKELYPERMSPFATRIAKEREPMIGPQYSLTSFNDHPNTTLEDVLKVCREAGV